MTEAEFDAWYDAQPDIQAEWSRGKVVLRMPESLEHNDILGLLIELFRAFVRHRKLGRVFFERVQIRLPFPSRREPDLVFLAKDRLKLLQQAHILGAPDLVVEIVSPETVERDYREKFMEYESSGVRELWLIDPGQKTLNAHTLKDGRYEHITEKRGRVASAVLPGFFLRAEWLWSAAEMDPAKLLKEMEPRQ
jgi:Uma2 family endonuclease